MKPLRTVLIRVELSGVIIVRADLETAWLIEAAAVCRGTDYKRSSIDNEREDGRRNLAGVRRGRNIQRLSHGVVRGHSCRERTNSPILSMGNQAERFPLKTVSKQGKWSEEFRRRIFTEQSPLLFELPQRLDPANQSAGTQH
jgi:hypothetical protein